MVIVAVIEVAVSLLIIRWLVKKKTGEPFSRKAIRKFVLLGAGSAFIIMIASLFASDEPTYSISNPVLVGFIDALTMAAMLEEGLKYVAFRLAMRKNTEVRCRLDAVLVAAIVAMGFNLLEDVEYSLLGDYSTLVRVFLPLHCLFGIIMGYYYGKAKATGRMKYHVLSLAMPILSHTVIDMWIIGIKYILDTAGVSADTLSEETIMSLPYAEYLEPLAIVAVITILVFFVLLVLSFRKISQWSKKGELQESIAAQSS